MDSKLHLIYAGEHYTYERFMVILFQKMVFYKFKAAILTRVKGSRNFLVTKEIMIDWYKGKYTKGEAHKESANDELESFFENLRTGENVFLVQAVTFLLPKLTEKEMQFIESKNNEHLKTYHDFCLGLNPDVKKEDMLKSESNSKFVYCLCLRRTEPFDVESIIEIISSETFKLQYKQHWQL